MGEAVKMLRELTPTTTPIRTVITQEVPKPLDVRIADKWHSTSGNWRPYFHSRGIDDAQIDRYTLGYREDFQRYSIPCFVEQQEVRGLVLWGIQYRMKPDIEAKVRATGEKPLRYISEKGSHNHQLFNAAMCKGGLPYCLVIEGPLDAVMLRRYGFPAVASFQGNNIKKPWDMAWNTYFVDVKTVLVVPDNDENKMGDKFATAKVEQIPHSFIKRLPPEVKDVGDLVKPWVQAGESDAQVVKRLSKWLGLPPIRTLNAVE